MTDVRVIVSSQDLFNKYLIFFSGQNTLLWTVSTCFEGLKDRLVLLGAQQDAALWLAGAHLGIYLSSFGVQSPAAAVPRSDVAA